LGPNLVAYAIPVFFLMIGVEKLVGWKKGVQVFRTPDALADLGCGISQQVVTFFNTGLLFSAYVWLYDHVRLFDLPGAVLPWVVAIVGYDFAYYWWHRMSHRVNFFWAAHVVHHQSEDYNLAVALRQGAFQGSFSWVFYLPLALLGLPPLVFLTLSSINTLYQFWIHTRVIGRLGPLEWVLNTPSNHRVHHGRNPRYIDRNHGGTLIVWDRLFGTYAREEEEPVYGITTPLASWNPVWANLHYWFDLVRRARRTSRLADKARLFWMPPGWNPRDLGGFVPAPEIGPAPSKFAVSIPRRRQFYVLAQFVALLLLASLFLFNQEQMTPWARAAAAAAIVGSLVILGAMLDGRRWAVPAEIVRVGAVALGTIVLIL
jgi:sterol desaturase/sphingolipid hydroxylase (fatty acid hydroxylase superfamily)